MENGNPYEKVLANQKLQIEAGIPLCQLDIVFLFAIVLTGYTLSNASTIPFDEFRMWFFTRW